MNRYQRRTTLAAMSVMAVSTLLALGLGVPAAQAQGAKPIRLVVGFPAGGSSDTLARLLAEALRGKFDGPVLVDNRAGAGGRLAAEYLKTADADGSVIFITPNPVVTIYPSIYKKLSYDPFRDMLPVAQVATYPLVLGVGPAVPATVKTVGDFVQWAREHPKEAFYASPAAGSTPHFVGVMMARAAGISLSHVGYKGDAPAIQDLLGGQIAMSINVPSAQLPHLASGRLRILATTGPKRMAQLPDVPTLAESGFPQIQTKDWFGAFVPPGTPAATLQKIQAAIQEALKTKAVQEGLAKQSLELPTATPAEFAKGIREEADQWAAVVKASGFTPED